MHQELIGLRRRHRWLHTAAPQKVHGTNEQLVHTVAGDGERLPVALDVAASPVRVPARGAGAVLAGSGTVGWDGVDLSAHGWAVLTGRRRRTAGTGDGGVAPAGRVGVH